MEKEWMKLIDTEVNESTSCHHVHGDIVDYVREQATIEDKRAIVQEVERRVKEVVNREENNPDFIFRNFSESERDLLDNLLQLRMFVLDEMMLQPSESEVSRLGALNDKLYKLTEECYEQCRNLWRTLYLSPYKVNDRFDYWLEGVLRFEYADKDSVLHLENDDYYGSDFDYMIHLTSELLMSAGNKMTTIVNGTCANFFETEEEAMKSLTNSLDDGVSWAEAHLYNKAYDKYCICYAMHALHTHMPWCLPDILRMDDFIVNVKLEYERNVSEQRDIRYADDGNENDPHWPEGVPCLGRE